MDIAPTLKQGWLNSWLLLGLFALTDRRRVITFCFEYK